LHNPSEVQPQADGVPSPERGLGPLCDGDEPETSWRSPAPVEALASQITGQESCRGAWDAVDHQVQARRRRTGISAACPHRSPAGTICMALP
jgi:hypothetical protein